MTNYWVARSEPAFAEWVAILPPVATPAAADRVLDLAAGILAAGEQAAVYTVEETPIPPGFRRSAAESYAQFLVRQYETTGQARLFHLGAGVAHTAEGRLWTPARVAHFDRTGARVESAVGDLGELLRELHPDDLDWGQSYMARVAPVTIQSAPLVRPAGSAGTRPFRLRVALFTDLWFPQVLAMLEDSQPRAPEPRIWYDNSALGQVHTPRLNDFLATVRALVARAGGTWAVEDAEGSAQHYAPMVGEAGIRLDKGAAG